MTFLYMAKMSRLHRCKSSHSAQIAKMHLEMKCASTQSCRTHCRQEACISVVMVLPLVVSCADLGRVNALFRSFSEHNPRICSWKCGPRFLEQWRERNSSKRRHVFLLFCPSTSSTNMVFSNPSWIGPCELSVGIRLQQVCDGLKFGPNRPSKSWNLNLYSSCLHVYHISVQLLAPPIGLVLNSWSW